MVRHTQPAVVEGESAGEHRGSSSDSGMDVATSDQSHGLPAWTVFTRTASMSGVQTTFLCELTHHVLR